jgi:short-subunit dehydrogenase
MTNSLKPLLNQHKYGSWALITGASRGIGKCFAEALAARGKNIVLVARNQTLLEQTAAQLSGTYGIKTLIIKADLAQTDDLIETLEATTAQLDIGLCIANAAISHFGQLHKSEAAPIVEMLNINVISLTLLCQYFRTARRRRHHAGLV